MGNVGHAVVIKQADKWVDLEVKLNTSFVNGTYYSISVENLGRVFLSSDSSEPESLYDGHPVKNEHFVYQHTTGNKLYVSSTFEFVRVNVSE